VVHGLQVFAFTAPGATLFPQYIGDVFVAFTSASCRFLKEVHAGDTLYPQLEIIKLRTQGDTGIVTTRATVHNQRGELVLDGEHTYSLKVAPAQVGRCDRSRTDATLARKALQSLSA
jgi:acyl dehydratase